MNTPSKPLADRVEIRKYSNRRYYDSTRSRHLTLEEIRDLVKEGHDIQVTDNQTAADITPKVLAQIILDLDARKLDVFPAELLAQLIRANDHLVKGFCEKFLVQALKSFIDYQGIMESQWKQSAVLPTMFPPMTAWAQAMMQPMDANPAGEGEHSSSAPLGPDANLARILTDLQRQMDALKRQVGSPKKVRRRTSRSRPRN